MPSDVVKDVNMKIELLIAEILKTKKKNRKAEVCPQRNRDVAEFNEFV